MAWGIYDSLQAQQQPARPGACHRRPPPPPAGAARRRRRGSPPEVARVVRWRCPPRAPTAASPTRSAQAILAPPARPASRERRSRTGVGPRPLAEIVGGVTADAERRDLYVLAFTIVRADETVSGAERIYLAQLAHELGLDAGGRRRARAADAAAIDARRLGATTPVR